MGYGGAYGFHNENGAGGAIIGSPAIGMFSQIENSVPVENTLVEGTLIGVGVGSLSVPANSFRVGDSFQANFSGHIDSRNNDTIRIRAKSSGILLADTGNIIMPNCTGQHWDIKCLFTIRAIGPSGVASIASTINFTYTKNASNAFEGENVSIVNSTTFDTTIANTLDVTAEWGAADPLNSIYTELFNLLKTY